MIDLQSTRLYLRFKATRPSKLIASEDEFREYYLALMYREITHGVREEQPDSTPLTLFGRPILRENGSPWTVGDVRPIVCPTCGGKFR